jgi:hypothetical protein
MNKVDYETSPKKINEKTDFPYYLIDQFNILEKIEMSLISPFL